MSEGIVRIDPENGNLVINSRYVLRPYESVPEFLRSGITTQDQFHMTQSKDEFQPWDKTHFYFTLTDAESFKVAIHLDFNKSRRLKSIFMEVLWDPSSGDEREKVKSREFSKNITMVSFVAYQSLKPERLYYRFPWGVVFSKLRSKERNAGLVVRYRDPGIKGEINMSAKEAPLFSYTTGELKRDIEDTPDYAELARKYRREQLAKFLGYVSYNELINQSVCFFEYQSINFYFSEHRANGRIFAWNVKLLMFFADFVSWRECYNESKSAYFGDVLKQEIFKLHDKSIELSRETLRDFKVW